MSLLHTVLSSETEVPLNQRVTIRIRIVVRSVRVRVGTLHSRTQ